LIVTGTRDAQIQSGAKEPNILSKEPCILSKEPDILSKEPYILSKEPYILSKEPVFSQTTDTLDSERYT